MNYYELEDIPPFLAKSNISFAINYNDTLVALFDNDFNGNFFENAYNVDTIEQLNKRFKPVYNSKSNEIIGMIEV